MALPAKLQIERIDYKLLAHLRKELEKLFSFIKEREDKLESVETCKQGIAA